MAAFPFFMKLWGCDAMEDFFAIPTRVNSSTTVGTMASEWAGTWPGYDMTTAVVKIDDLYIGEDGFSVFIRARAHSVTFTQKDFPLRDGTKLDVAGKTVTDVHYTYKITFDPATKKIALFEPSVDVAELGRMMGCPTFALASASTPLYTV